MVKAKDLIESQKKRENIKYKSFYKIYENIEKKIILASSSNFYSVSYEIPNFIIGYPFYNLDECKKFIKKNIEKDGFEIEEIERNIILIKWFPK